MYLGSTAKSTFGWKTLFSWKDVCARPRTLSENQPRKVSYYWAKRAAFVFIDFVCLLVYALRALFMMTLSSAHMLTFMRARLYKTPKKARFAGKVKWGFMSGFQTECGAYKLMKAWLAASCQRAWLISVLAALPFKFGDLAKLFQFKIHRDEKSKC